MDKIRIIQSQLPTAVFDEVCNLIKHQDSKSRRHDTVSYTREGQKIHMIELNKISAEKKMNISNHLQYRQRHPQRIKNINFLIIIIIIGFIVIVYLIIIILLFV